MLSLFKSKTKKVNGEYPQIVKDIHNEFNLAGDKLLKQAQDIIASIRIDNEDKVKDLKRVGFGQAKEVKETEEKIKEKKDNEKIANIITELKIKYPQYKFITTAQSLQICKKYGLVIGEVGLFKGFVPEKNLKEIKSFLDSENELSVVCYLERDSGRSYFSHKTPISLEEYEERKRKERELYEIEHNGMSQLNTSFENRVIHNTGYREYLGKQQKQLFIAAPLKDMDITNHKLDGFVLRKKEVPDPVVLCPYHKDGFELYCIVTAWGDEASDPIVVNETMN